MKLSDIHLVLCDLDGTLLHEDKTPDFFVKEILTKKKIPMTFVSGRNVQIIQEYIACFDIQLPYITNNGANIFYKDQCIYEKSIDVTELIPALKILKENEASFLVYSQDKIFSHGFQPKLESFKKRLEGKCLIVQNFTEEQIARESIFKVVMIHECTDRMDRICQKIQTKFANCCCVRSEGSVYTLTHKDASKGKAIQWLLRYLHIDAKHVLAFGDNYNDVSMFKSVGISVAMANADPSVQEQADCVTKSNDENGVSKFIEQYVE